MLCYHDIYGSAPVTLRPTIQPISNHKLLFTCLLYFLDLITSLTRNLCTDCTDNDIIETFSSCMKQRGFWSFEILYLISRVGFYSTKKLMFISLKSRRVQSREHFSCENTEISSETFSTEKSQQNKTSPPPLRRF